MEDLVENQHLLETNKFVFMFWVLLPVNHCEDYVGQKSSTFLFLTEFYLSYDCFYANGVCQMIVQNSALLLSNSPTGTPTDVLILS